MNKPLLEVEIRAGFKPTEQPVVDIRGDLEQNLVKYREFNNLTVVSHLYSKVISRAAPPRVINASLWPLLG